MDMQSFSKNRHVRSLQKFNECYALIMLLIFSVVPVMAIFSPQDFGPIYTGIGQLMIYSLLFLGAFQLISYATFNTKSYSVEQRLEFCIKRAGTSFIKSKVGILLFVFLMLVVISSVHNYLDGNQVVANLEYANKISNQDAKNMFDTMSFTDTRLYKGTDFRPDGLRMYLYFAVVFIYAMLIKNKSYKKCVFIVNIISFVLVSLVVLQQYYGILGSAGVKEAGAFGKKLSAYYDSKGIRIGHFFKGLTGSFYNLNHVGYYITVGSLLISGMVIVSKKATSKILWSLLAAYSYYIMIINDTFGCYIAILAALAIVGILKLFADLKLLQKGTYKVWQICLNSLLPFILFIAISASFIAISGEDNSISKNFKTFGKDIKTVATSDDKEKEEKTGSGRMKMWVATVKMIQEKPILGYGPDNLKAEYVENDTTLDRAHNEPLEKAVSVGIPATIVYYGAVILAVVLFIKKRQNFMEPGGLISFLALVGYLISSLFGVFLFYTAGYFVMMLAFIASSEPVDVVNNNKLQKNK